MSEPKRIPLAKAIERAAALKWLRQRGMGIVVKAAAPAGMTAESVHYENRATRRAQGERKHTHGLGAMAPSVSSRRRGVRQ